MQRSGRRIHSVVVIVILFALQVADGVDQAALSFTAPFVKSALGIGFESLGAAFSAGYIGTALGAVLFGTLADSMGRKNTLLLAAMAFSVGSFCTTVVHTAPQLIAVRFATGLALGGMFPVIAASIFEVVPRHLRATAVTLTSVGTAAGVSLCGPLVAAIEPRFEWRAVFMVGGAVPALLAILVFLFIPSPSVAKQPPGISNRAVRNPLDSITSLFRRGRWRVTLLLWAAFVMSAVPMFFSLSWLPSLAHMAQINARIAAIGPSIFAVSGLIFAILVARLIDKKGSLYLPLALTTALGAPAFVLLGDSFGNDHLFLLACGIAGALSVGSVNLFGVAAGMAYEDHLRARGIGWAVATMRFGAALAPWVGGLLIARAPPVQMLFLGLAISPLISGIAILGLWRMARPQEKSPA